MSLFKNPTTFLAKYLRAVNEIMLTSVGSAEIPLKVYQKMPEFRNDAVQ